MRTAPLLIGALLAAAIAARGNAVPSASGTHRRAAATRSRLGEKRMISRIVKHSPWYAMLAATLPAGERPSFLGENYNRTEGVFQVGLDTPIWFETDGRVKVLADGRIYRWNALYKKKSDEWLLDYAPPGVGAATPKLTCVEIQAIVGATRDGKYGPGTARKVRAFQRMLIHLGYLHGKADGIWGPETERAYERYISSRTSDLRPMRGTVKRPGCAVCSGPADCERTGYNGR